MKKVSNMSELFERLNDLKSIFWYGQKLIPIIQSIIDFMRDTVPLLDDINHSIADSTSKMPKAKDQITNVSSATELATTEILDIVDSISADLGKIETIFNDVQKEEENKRNIWNNIKKLFPNTPEAETLIKKYENNKKFESQSQVLLNSFNKIKNDVYNISLSLQVQDITSQQLAAVNHLIESVQKRLASLIVHLDESDIKNFEVQMINETDEKTFDADARYTKDSNKQDSVDLIINSTLNKASQDEIDKLFS
jgi:chemotaxis regulatin CheY-phosphate phosphatase CheZ